MRSREEIPEYYTNFDLDQVVTPIKVGVYEELLRESGYPEEKIDFLVRGFSVGFDLMYMGPTDRKDTADNLPLTLGSKTELWNKVMKEVKTGRYAGPYPDIPFDSYMQSPIGLVPKAGNKTRLIFHLSYNFKGGQGSVNSNTPEDICKVKYNDLDHAMRNCIQLLKTTELWDDLAEESVIFFSKTDLLSAFRILPLSKNNYR